MAFKKTGKGKIAGIHAKEVMVTESGDIKVIEKEDVKIKLELAEEEEKEKEEGEQEEKEGETL